MWRHPVGFGCTPTGRVPCSFIQTGMMGTGQLLFSFMSLILQTLHKTKHKGIHYFHSRGKHQHLKPQVNLGSKFKCQSNPGGPLRHVVGTKALVPQSSQCVNTLEVERRQVYQGHTRSDCFMLTTLGNSTHGKNYLVSKYKMTRGKL